MSAAKLFSFVVDCKNMNGAHMCLTCIHIGENRCHYWLYIPRSTVYSTCV